VATNLHIDEQLLEEALRVSGKKTKREVVNEALEEYVRSRKQKDILDLFNKIDFDKSYDYKQARSAR
jgi:Arc/MetJ family transcription regulator